jgi:hypothetical protein
MNRGRILALVLVVVAFAAGLQWGKKTGGGAPVVTSSSGGAAYGGSISGQSSDLDVAAVRELIV